MQSSAKRARLSNTAKATRHNRSILPVDDPMGIVFEFLNVPAAAKARRACKTFNRIGRRKKLTVNICHYSTHLPVININNAFYPFNGFEAFAASDNATLKIHADARRIAFYPWKTAKKVVFEMSDIGETKLLLDYLDKIDGVTASSLINLCIQRHLDTDALVDYAKSIVALHIYPFSYRRVTRSG